VREEKTIVITSFKLKLPYLHGTEITEQQETLQCHLPNILFKYQLLRKENKEYLGI
jgi:hypothetical protein